MLGMLLLVLSLLFTGAIIWASHKFVSLFNHNTAFTKYNWRQKDIGYAALSQGRDKMVQFHIFLFSLYLKNMIIYAYKSWLNTCIVIVSRFLPNIMIIGQTFFTWDHFFLSYAILPRLPLNCLVSGLGLCLDDCAGFRECTWERLYHR